MCMLTVNSVLSADILLQVWEYMGKGPNEVMDQMIRAAHRSLLGAHIQTCLDIIRWLRPFAVSLDPDSGEFSSFPCMQFLDPFLESSP